MSYNLNGMVESYAQSVIARIINMQNARAERSISSEPMPFSPRARVTSVDELSVANLPQAGSSPAIDLQRRLGEAALRGFYAAKPIQQGVRRKNYALAVAVAVLAWGVVFAIGVTVVG
jgi:hypothetical protein